mmetsp:Transcript_10968/g.27801  ORF Transcript_10968/g.27801 Transcript_10968/m.27801 type:complete len:200 (-) Transcript_10968:838-1437(-)
MLEAEHAALLVHANAVPRVVEHSHDVPRRTLRHRVLALIPRAEDDLLRLRHLAHRHIELPEKPAPVLCVIATASRRPARLLFGVKWSETPCHATIQTNLHADDLAPAATVRVSLDRVRLALAVDNLVVPRVCDGAVDVDVVDDVLRLEPPLLGIRLFGVHHRRQHAVVVEVVEVVALLVRDLDLRQPLDCAPAYVSRKQ